MKALLLALSLLLLPLTSHALDGSWFGIGGAYEHLSSGGNTRNGASVDMEGGYWYLGNVAYGGEFKANFLDSNLTIYNLGGFWKAGTEEGLYGKLLAGVAFMSGNSAAVGSNKSFYFGLGGGFSFPVTATLKIGPEVIYRHLTAGYGGDQISIGALVTQSF